MALTAEETRQDTAPTAKACRKCGETKAISEFYRNKGSRDGRSNSCKVCNNASTYAWRAANPGGHARIQQKYRTKHPERAQAATDRWLAKHPEHHSERMKRRWADPQERRKLLDIKRERRHRARANGGRGLTREQTRALLAQPCAYCGAKATQIDHVIPVSRGGTHDPDNVVPACKHCNAQKWTFTPEEWKARRAARLEVGNGAHG